MLSVKGGLRCLDAGYLSKSLKEETVLYEETWPGFYIPVAFTSSQHLLLPSLSHLSYLHR